MGLCAPAPRRGCTWACPPPLPKVSERCGEDVWGCRGGQEGAGNQSWSDGMLHRAKAQHCKPWGGRWGRGCGCPVCLQGGMREWGPRRSPWAGGHVSPVETELLTTINPSLAIHASTRWEHSTKCHIPRAPTQPCPCPSTAQPVLCPPAPCPALHPPAALQAAVVRERFGGAFVLGEPRLHPIHALLQLRVHI